MQNDSTTHFERGQAVLGWQEFLGKTSSESSSVPEYRDLYVRYQKDANFHAAVYTYCQFRGVNHPIMRDLVAVADIEAALRG